MNAPRAFIAAELLLNGKVLIMAGEDIVNGTTTSLTSAELFDPSLGRWNLTGSLASPAGNVGTRLSNGDVLLLRQALFNSATDTWSVTGAYPKAVGGGGTGATLLGTGNVLVTGFICITAAVRLHPRMGRFCMNPPRTCLL